MSQPILSDSPENDLLAQDLQDCMMRIRSRTLEGPRHGFLTAMAQRSGVYAFDTTALDDLPDVLSDGATVLVRASALSAAFADEDASPAHGLRPVLLILAGLAQASSFALGFEEADPLAVAIAAEPQAEIIPLLSLASATFGALSPERLSQLLAPAHPVSAQALADAAGAAGAEAARANVAQALSSVRLIDPADATPFQAIAQRFAFEGLRSGAIVEPSPNTFQTDYQASTVPAFGLVQKLLLGREARQEASILDATAKTTQKSRPAPSV